MITHLEPDILEGETKWPLGSITTNKASEGDGIPVELISNCKRCCCESAAFNIPANLENSAVVTGLEKVSFYSNPKEREGQTVFKLPHKFTHLTCWHSNTQNSSSQASIVHEPEPLDVQAGFRKGRGTRDQIVSVLWIIEKARDSIKKHLLLLH